MHVRARLLTQRIGLRGSKKHTHTQAPLRPRVPHSKASLTTPQPVFQPCTLCHFPFDSLLCCCPISFDFQYSILGSGNPGVNNLLTNTTALPNIISTIVIALTFCFWATGDQATGVGSFTLTGLAWSPLDRPLQDHSAFSNHFGGTFFSCQTHYCIFDPYNSATNCGVGSRALTGPVATCNPGNLCHNNIALWKGWTP